jgi:subtilisin family serine protease
VIIHLAVAAVVALSPPAGATPAGEPAWDDQLHQAWAISHGDDVTVGLVDTGVDATEPGLAGRVLPGAEFPDLGAGTADAVGHGTTMALLVAGAAPGAKILPARLDGSAADANDAIRWVVDHGATVVNLSLGSTPDSTDYDEGLRYARQHDVVVVAAAGDSTIDSGVVSPADRPGVLAVSAVDATGAFRGDVSVQGDGIALAAPGVDIRTARREETHPTSGTSQAAALVSAVAALVRAEYPTMTATEVADRLTATARDSGPAGRDRQYGYGIVDPVRALTAPVPASPVDRRWAILAGLTVLAAGAAAFLLAGRRVRAFPRPR